MSDLVDDAAGDRTTSSVSEAYSTARELLAAAEADAAEVRLQADRYLRRREQEAELLVAKARRVLMAAEDRASLLTARAREQALDRLATADAAVPPGGEPEEQVTVIDLVAEELPAGEADLPPWKDRGLSPTDSGLDRILASAISNAVQRALPAER